MPAVAGSLDGFVARTWILDGVVDWLDGGDERIFLLSGDPGTGKSVVSEWLSDVGAPTGVSDSTALARVRDGWHARYRCSQRYVGASTDPRAFVRDVADQLRTALPGFAEAQAGAHAALVEGSAVVHGPASGDVAGVRVGQLVIEGKTIEETFEQALETPLRAVLAQRTEPVRLVVDGLDEALTEAPPTIVDLVARLARVTGPLRLLVTSQNDRAVTDELTAIDGADVRRLDLSSDDAAAQVDADIESLIAGSATAGAMTVVLRRQVREAAHGNFLHAQGLLEDLDVLAVQAGAGPLPRSLVGRYDRHLQQLLERGYGGDWREAWAGAVGRLFAMLAVARDPVPEATLAAWLGEPPELVRMTADGFQQLLAERDGRLALYHPAFAAFLLPSEGRPDRFDVDPAAAHARIVEHYRALVTSGGWAASDDYGLLHLSDHLAGALAAETSAAGAIAQASEALELIERPDLIEEIARRVADPIAAGRPFRRMAALLLELDQPERLESLVDHVADAAEPAVRATALDALLGYADRRPDRARALICRMAVSASRQRRLAGLRATRRLPRAEQVLVYDSVIRHGDEGARKDAAYAVYLGWNTVPTDLTGGVLSDLGDKASLLRPRRLKPLLEFLASATITNYINNCSDPRVAELTSTLWRRVLVERLHVGVVNRPFLERTLIAPAMARHLADRVLTGVLDFDGPSDGGLVSALDGEAESARRVIARLDPAVELKPVEADLARLLASDAVALRILAGQVLAVHAMTDFATAEPTFAYLGSLPSARARTAALLSLTVILPEAPREWLESLAARTEELVDADPELSVTLTDPLLAGFDGVFVPLGLAYGRQGSRLELHERLIASASTSPAVRRAALLGAGVAGIYHPNAVLATFDSGMEADAGFAATPDASEALALIANLHPDLVDDWLGRWSAEQSRAPIQALAQRDGAHRYVEMIGLYTNGVHQGIHYPIMRRGLLMPAFELLLTASSRRDWARRYTTGVLDMLREADYTLIEWTR